MKEEFKDIDGKTWQEIFQYYWPKITNEAINVMLWEHTCYPFSSKEAAHQVFEIYQEQFKSGLTS